MFPIATYVASWHPIPFPLFSLSLALFLMLTLRDTQTCLCYIVTVVKNTLTRVSRCYLIFFHCSWEMNMKYIYIYVYYFWRNVWSKKSLSESSSFYAPTEPLSKKHRIKMFDVFILRRTRHCTLFNVNSEYSLVKYFVIVVSNTSIHNSKSLCEEWVWTIKDLNLLQLL